MLRMIFRRLLVAVPSLVGVVIVTNGDGFAKTHAEEKRCLDLELNVLMSIEDVTERVNAAVKTDLSPEAAFAAMQRAASNGWYGKKDEKEFGFFYYWDTPSEMKEFMEDEWEDFEKMEDHVYQKASSMWASANADARLRVRVNMLITLWEKRWVAL